MRSSTSSSETGGVAPRLADGRLVSGGWGGVLAVAAALSLLVLGAWEGSWRRRGVAPSLTDLEDSWNVVRDGVGRDSVVLVGTSKMQSALDPRLLGGALGREPALQLALIDRSPVPVLEELARDVAFAGTAVIDVAPRIVFDAEGEREATAEAVLDAYRVYLESPGERLGARLGMLAESSLTLRRPALSLRRLVEWPLTGQALRPPFARVRRDRFRELDFSRLDLASRRRSQATIAARVGRPLTEEEMAVLAARVVRAAGAIRERGGAVVLAMLPVSGRARLEEEGRFPRSSYWDELVGATGLPSIHFADHPPLAAFDCADGVHLDTATAHAFTLAFAEILAPHLPI